MTGAVRRTLAAGALLVVCACTSDTLNAPLGRPFASFSDGAHSGNPDFFFLPPLFKSPVNDPNFSPNAFNASVRPTVEICELANVIVPPATIRACATTVKTFGASEVTLSTTDQLYQVNWNTSLTNLVLTKEYRIRVLLGSVELGFVDVDPVVSGSQLKNVETGEFVGLVDGRTLPIKFRIENGAACFGGLCNSKTINLAQGGFVVFAATGDRVDIPAQQSNQIVNVTVQACPNLNVDFPVFGNCLNVLADPPLAARLAPAATVSMCSLPSFALPPLHAQEELLTLHRRDGNVVVALPHSTDFCGGTIGLADAPRSLALRGLRALRDVGEWLFRPTTLHASNLVFDVGAGGQTDGFSDFQFALPAAMSFASLANQTVVPNSAVPSTPSVLVTDALGQPVANARVHFTITSPGGTIAPSNGIVLSNSNGFATLTQWSVGDAGRYSVQASGFGLAGPDFNGPAEGVDPFTPAIFHDPAQDEAQAPVTLGTGHLSFVANAQLATGTLTFVQPPTDQIGNLRTLSVVVRAQDAAGAVLPAVQITLKDGPQNASLGCGMGGAQLTAVTDAVGQATFSLIDVSAACETATLVATGTKVGFAPMSVESRPFAIADIGGTGTPTIDGQFDPSWAGARCLQFVANIPGGGTTPAMLCAMNDETNVYFLVRFTRGPDPRSSVDFQFDQNRSGGINSGDDLIVFRNPEQTFEDDHWFDATVDPSCPASSICSRSDASAGGSVDGQGAFGNNGAETVYEISHPLNSGDSHDISAGRTVDFFLGLNIYPSTDLTGLARTFFPSGRLLKLLVK